MSRRTIDWRLHYQPIAGEYERLHMVYTGIHHKIRDFNTECDALSAKGAWWFVEGDVTMCILCNGDIDPPAAQWKMLPCESP